MRLIQIVVLFCLSTQAAIAATYSYTGIDMDVGSRIYPFNITGYFETSTSLGANLDNVLLGDIVDFSFTDGSATLSTANAGSAVFRVSTDSAGNLSDWQLDISVAIAGSSPPSVMGSLLSFDISSTPVAGVFPVPGLFDTASYEGTVCVGLTCSPSLANYRSYAAGGWASSVIPIPAAVWLFGSALAGLGWMRS